MQQTSNYRNSTCSIQIIMRTVTCCLLHNNTLNVVIYIIRSTLSGHCLDMLRPAAIIQFIK